MSQPPFSHTHHHTLGPPTLKTCTHPVMTMMTGHDRALRWWALPPFYLLVPTHIQLSTSTSTPTSYHHHRWGCGQTTQPPSLQMITIMAGGPLSQLTGEYYNNLPYFFPLPTRYIHTHTVYPCPHGTSMPMPTHALPPTCQLSIPIPRLPLSITSSQNMLAPHHHFWTAQWRQWWHNGHTDGTMTTWMTRQTHKWHNDHTDDLTSMQMTQWRHGQQVVGLALVSATSSLDDDNNVACCMHTCHTCTLWSKFCSRQNNIYIYTTRYLWPWKTGCNQSVTSLWDFLRAHNRNCHHCATYTTGNCGPHTTGCSSVQLPVFYWSGNWALKH